jgi:hypothetical protein
VLGRRDSVRQRRSRGATVNSWMSWVSGYAWMYDTYVGYMLEAEYGTTACGPAGHD